jgi:hypothetical protein
LIETIRETIINIIPMKNRLNITFTSRESNKISELNYILDKISVNKELTTREQEFLSKYENIQDDDLKDFNYLSLLDLFYLISKINKVIFCDIKDKFGKINEEIKSMDYDHDESTILLGLKHGTYKLTDNFFYKLIYIFKSDTYSLDIESEYHEKINLEK